MRVPGERTAQIVLVAVALLAVLAVLAVLRATYDGGPTPEERRCTELRASANAVAGREDTVDDELEYLRRAKAADKACAGLDTAFGGRPGTLVEPGEPLGEPVSRPARPASLIQRHTAARAGRTAKGPELADQVAVAVLRRDLHVLDAERRGPSNACT